MTIQHKIKQVINKDNKPPLLVLRIYKRHILAVAIIIAVIIFSYAAYFKFFMVLPQSAVHIMPEFPYPLENQKILIISPHCDDESLGAAGLIQQSRRNGSDIKIVITTDCNHHDIGNVREEESKKALNSLGISASQIDFLNFPEVESNKKDNPSGLSISQAIDKEIAGFQPTLIISPHPDDTHIDHKTAGLTVKDLIHAKYPGIKVAYYLIHYNFMHYPDPSGFHPEDYLLPPARLIGPWQKWYILNLSDDEEEIKRNAVSEYKSQLSLKNPILHEILLDFVRKNELFMVPE